MNREPHGLAKVYTATETWPASVERSGLSDPVMAGMKMNLYIPDNSCPDHIQAVPPRAEGFIRNDPMKNIYWRRLNLPWMRTLKVKLNF